MNDIQSLAGTWCVFLKGSAGGSQIHDAVLIHEVEEIGIRFGGVPYIRFRASHNTARVIEILGNWSIKTEYVA
jgi:hypothetical protein